MPVRLWQPDWYPGSQLVVELHEALGCLRSSAYHNWPYRSAWGPRHDAQARTWLRTCLPRWDSKQAFRQAKLTRALATGRMIDEPDGLTVHPLSLPTSALMSEWPPRPGLPRPGRAETALGRAQPLAAAGPSQKSE